MNNRRVILAVGMTTCAISLVAHARFLSVDPVKVNTSLPTNFNRYHYAGNNPYKFTDPDGREVHVAGNADDQKDLLKLNEKYSGMKLSQSSDGLWHSTACTMDQSSASPIFGKVLMDAINSPNMINITAVRADPNVFGDQYKSGKVDVADIQGFASRTPQMGQAVLTHIFAEYTAASGMQGGQVMSNFDAAHAIGARAESPIFGAAFRSNTVDGPFPSPGTTITFDYTNARGRVIKSFDYTLDQNNTPR